MRTTRRVLSMLAGVMLAAPVLLSGGNALAVTGGGWGTAIEVPGTAALNAGNQAQLYSMSCPSSGNCAAVGWYTDATGNRLPFVVNETGGVWGNAIEAPGIAALGINRTAQLVSVSCSSPGNCLAGGSYVLGVTVQAFVVDETGGVWGNAIEVPGTAALNTGGFAEVYSVSCAPAAAGNCSAAGEYANGKIGGQAFVADETGGVWGNAIDVPGVAAMSVDASAYQVSCPAAGNCAVGGYYQDSAGNSQPFVDGESSGVWGNAIELPGAAALNAGGDGSLDALSCPSAGNCSAAGRYSPGTGEQLFVAQEKKGTWAPAAEMPGIATLDTGQATEAPSMSCTSSGNCAAGGFYETSAGLMTPFVVNQTGGVWGQAAEVPGISSLANGKKSAVQSVSCSSAGNCVAGGYVARKAFVANESGGVWHPATVVPGTQALNRGFNASAYAVSCARAGTCALGGFYTVAPPKSNETHVFVDTRS